MLELTDITKSYRVGETVTRALKGVSVSFRSNEFVAVLGPSGCGKTTLLNVIGGLDRYDSGELIIDGLSTKRYRDADWDNYRNHSVGFVFQTYNLIPHQTVLSNVELALTLSGVGKIERRRRALEALDKVGIADQANKKPNQLSGGQMQRVAIARALVNDPEILLADEPTGALDSGTSIQIMELLKEVASDRLVIMVTHNPDLAKTYATRIVNLHDGCLVSDSDPYDPAEEAKEKEETADEKSKKAKKKKKDKRSMSFFTALSLSLNNLMTKKARTILTSFAGSIGIIGIALILSMRSGFEAYINRVQEDTLSTYPITIEAQNMDFSAILGEMSGRNTVKKEHGLDKVYASPVFGKMLNSLLAGIYKNDLKAFRDYIEANRDELEPYTNDIKYTYGVELNLYTENSEGKLVKVNPLDTFSELMRGEGSSFAGGSLMGMSNTDVWQELVENRELLELQYDTVYGRWPESYNEAVLFVNSDNEINDYILCALGVIDQDLAYGLLSDDVAGKKFANDEMTEYEYEDICAIKFKLVSASLKYSYNDAAGIWEDRGDDESYMKWVCDNYAEEVRIVGIMRPNETAAATSVSSGIGYTHALTEHCIALSNASEIVKQQKSSAVNAAATAKYGKEYLNCEVDVFTGIPFGYTAEQKTITIEDVRAYIAALPEAQQAMITAMTKLMSEEELVENLSKYIEAGNKTTKATYNGNLQKLGAAELDTPTGISLYAKDFESKNRITEFIDAYNEKAAAGGQEDKAIKYTDFMGAFLDSVSTIIDTISYVLIAFVAISLVVSSIMIGVITYISVLERTKEIGILRSIGASRRDIARVFNAETLIVGFASGVFGILLTLLLNIPVNVIIYSLSKIPGFAFLPWLGGLILVAISMLLTLVAGLIPSRLAARKDPVVALRTE